MPFDFTMYLIKADDCIDDVSKASVDDVSKSSVADVNNNKTLTASEAITCIPGRTFTVNSNADFDLSNSPVNVFNFSRAHIFSEEIASLRHNLQTLKMELPRSENGGKKVVCNGEKLTESRINQSLNCSNGIHNHNNGKNDSEICKMKSLHASKSTHGPFTTMLMDFTNIIENEVHDDSMCFIAHCHLCKGPKRALSIDSARMRPKVRRRVTFADDNGMPLTKVRVMPRPPANDKTSPITSLDIYGIHGRYKTLRLDFPQPAADFTTFLERLRFQNVSLENMKTDGTSFLGTVRVKNLAMEKDVLMRFTTDAWNTWTDIVASYVYEDATSSYDLFGFHVSVGHLPNEVEFAICYKVRDQEHWDNNDGKNYKLKMISH